MANQLKQKLNSLFGKQSDDLVITKVDHATKTVTVQAASQGLQLPQGVTVNQQALQQALRQHAVQQANAWQQLSKPYFPPKPTVRWFPDSARLAISQPVDLMWDQSSKPVQAFAVYDLKSMKAYVAPRVSEHEIDKLGDAVLVPSDGYALRRVTDHQVIIGPNGTTIIPEKHRWLSDGGMYTGFAVNHYGTQFGRPVSDYENNLLNQHYESYIASLVVT